MAFDNGVKPSEISEIITHPAFCPGWANAISAVAVTKDLFARRKIGRSAPVRLWSGPSARRSGQNGQRSASRPAARRAFPGIAQYTTDVRFHDLWLRPDLTPRDRSLVTVSALMATGQVAQMPYHLNRAMDNGLTQPRAAEVITHLAFYVRWPNAFSALPVAKDVLAKHPH